MTAREMLDQIDNFFMTARPYESKMLRDVLSALRGPDDGDETVKLDTTQQIRRAAFPRVAADDSIWYTLGAMFYPAPFTLARTPFGHFRTHARWAAEVLELVDGHIIGIEAVVDGADPGAGS